MTSTDSLRNILSTLIKAELPANIYIPALKREECKNIDALDSDRLHLLACNIVNDWEAVSDFYSISHTKFWNTYLKEINHIVLQYTIKKHR